MSVDWNLDDIQLIEFPIIQIKFTSIENIQSDDASISQLRKSIPIRLFILSHRIAHFGIPSIFTESTPNYLDFDQIQSQNNILENIPSVIVFDIHNKFDDFFQNFQLPTWAVITKINWSLKNPNINPNNENNTFFDLSEEFFDDLQQAITLKIHYQYFLLKPLYFTSYILVPPQTVIKNSRNINESNIKINSVIEPTIIQPVPSFVANSIRIRWVIQPNLSCVVNPRSTPKIGSYILFPPFRHPLCITSITKEKTKIYNNLPDSTENKNTTGIAKPNSKVIPIPITKGTIKAISPTLSLNFTTEETTIITAITIDKEESITFQIPLYNATTKISTDYVLLAKPTIALHYFFYNKNFQYEFKKLPNKYSYQKNPQLQKTRQPNQPATQTSYPQFCQFENLEIFNFTEKDIDNFFTKHFSEEASKQSSSVSDQQEIVVSYIEDTVPSPQQLIGEQISDEKVKKTISKTINSILIRYNPNISVSASLINTERDTQSLTLFMKRVNLDLPKISYSHSKCISFFNFLNFSEFYGFSSSFSPPIGGQFFNYKNVSSVYHLEIPSILLTQDGTAKTVPADDFISSWERERYMPIYGPKDCHFVVFYETFNTNNRFGGLPSINSRLDSNEIFPRSTDDLTNQYVNEETIPLFMSQLSDAYSQFCFGVMKPFSKEPAYVPVKVQPLTKSSTFSNSSKTNKTLSETVTTKVEMDIDSGMIESESMKRAVFTFLSSEALLQFQDFPIVAFIIGGPSCHFFTLENDKAVSSSMNFMDNDQCPHIHTVYISPEMIINATEEKIKELAFIVYGGIRTYKQGPIGNIEFILKQKLLTQKAQHQIQQLQSQQGPNQEIQIQQLKKRIKYTDFFYKLFFGYRYQPPFILKQLSDSLYTFNIDLNTNNGINLNVAWDRFSGVAVWTNDAGDLLHSVDAQAFNDILFMITSLRSFNSNLIKKISISLLEEYLGQSFCEKFIQYLPADVDLFTIYHAPMVKARFSDTYKGDIAIFEESEVKNGISKIPLKKLNEMQNNPAAAAANPNNINNITFVFDPPANPEATCYVLSQLHPAYKVSIYKGGGQERLLQFVKTMSHLSWLSVKPGCENRSSSYPPHINALIQQNKSNCTRISQFEFLPI